MSIWPASVSVHCVRVQKSEESIRSSEAEQWTILSHRVGAGNHIVVLWKGSQCSKLLSLLSSSTPDSLTQNFLRRGCKGMGKPTAGWL